MEFQTKYITPEVKLSCYEDKLFKTEVTFDYHMLVWFLAGEAKIIQAEAVHQFNPGDVFLIPRNQPVTAIVYSKNGIPHRSVSMHLTTTRLKNFYADLTIKPGISPIPKVRHYHKHPLLESFLASLIPYFDLKDPFPENIASLKITEAISILRAIDEDIDGVLANFEEPGKIDLMSFMEKNFMFNMSLKKFGYLTGRSLSTFNRDFRKHFNITPQKWLTQKRLELAHYEISEKRKKPSDVYLEVGFEDLSHFSHAFKSHFGYSPTKLTL